MLRTLSVDAGEDRWLPADCGSYTNTSISSVGWPSPTPRATNGTTGICFQGLTPAYDSAGSTFSKANSEDTKWCCSEAQKTLKINLNVFAFKNSIILNKTWPLLSLLQTVFVVTLNHASLGLYVYTISNIIIISNYFKYYILNKIKRSFIQINAKAVVDACTWRPLLDMPRPTKISI